MVEVVQSNYSGVKVPITEIPCCCRLPDLCDSNSVFDHWQIFGDFKSVNMTKMLVNFMTLNRDLMYNKTDKTNCKVLSMAKKK